MLDDYAYGYTEMSNPGEFEVVAEGTIKHALRLVAVIPGTDGKPEEVYFNIAAGTATAVPT
jgi:hypothetical protein